MADTTQFETRVSPRETIPESEAQSKYYKRSATQALVFFLPFLRNQWSRVLLIALFDLSVVFLNFIPPWFGTALIDRAFPSRDAHLAIVLLAGYFGVQLLTQVVTAARGVLYPVMANRLQFDLRRAMVRKLNEVSIGFVEAFPAGQRVFRVRSDTDTVGGVLSDFFPSVTQFVDGTFIVVAVATLDRGAALILLAFTLPWVIAYYGLTGVYRNLDRARLLKAESRDAAVLEGVSSFSLLKSFGRSRWATNVHTRRSIVTQRIAQRHFLITWMWGFFGIMLLPYVRTAVIGLYLYVHVIHGSLTYGYTVPVIAYVSRFGDPYNGPLAKLMDFVNRIRRAMIPAERCMQILQVRSSVPKPAHPINVTNVEGRLEFKDVHFAYPECREIIEGLNLTVPAGRRVAIVGESGAGKSTLALLATRLYDPTSGSVTVDGVDLRQANSDMLLGQFAIVTQETYVFKGTLADNLRYGRRDATAPDMELALDQAGLGEWRSTLSLGLDTDMASGAAMSAGQRQRLGVARALLTRPKVMILDEPTAALDAETEATLMDTLWEITAGITVLLVTHRLNTVSRADEVHVLKEGRIVESGSFEDLAAAAGPFAQMLELFYAAPEPSA